MLSVHVRGQGEIDCRRERFADYLFLLRENGTVVGRRADAAKPFIGDDFFAHYGINTLQVSKLCRIAVKENIYPVLFAEAKKPILIFRSLLPSSDLLVALVPADDELCSALACPADMVHCLPDVQLTKKVSVLHPTISAQQAQLAAEWYAPLHYLFDFEPLSTTPTVNDFLLVLSHRLTTLARLCGCHLSYDLSGAGATPVKRPDWDGITSTLIAVFLAARRLSVDHSLSLHIENDGITPTLHALMQVHDATDPLPELQHFNVTSSMRASLFSTKPIPTDSRLLHVRISLSRFPIANQGLRTRHHLE